MKDKNKSTEVAVVTTSPANLLELAVKKGANIEELKGLMDLQDRWNAQQAKKAYYLSMSKFQKDCPPILKTKAGYDNRYYYAPLDQIIKVIKNPLFKNQLTYRWEQEEKDSKILVTCIITHVDGHSEQTTLESVPDTSGGKNAIQSKGSTVQYLRRYTLESVLGIATSSIDNDGGKPDKKPKVTEQPKISKDKSKELLDKAKIIIDEYTEVKDLQANYKGYVKDQVKAGMHQKDIDDLKKYINTKNVSLKKAGQTKSVDLP